MTDRVVSNNRREDAAAEPKGAAARAEAAGFDLMRDDPQINEKGARDYIRAARILTDDEDPPRGPIIQCQGQAIEIALKLCLVKRGKTNPEHHDLVRLHKKECPDITLSDRELQVLKKLNGYYFEDKRDKIKYSGRYRPSSGRVITMPGQQEIESLLESLLSQQNPK